MIAARTAACVLGAMLLLLGVSVAQPDNEAEPDGAAPNIATLEAPKFEAVKWPFDIDQWGRGNAFRCGPENCGVEIKVYVRAKIGFCNCTTGVADDAELDRVSDISLISDKFMGVRTSEPVRVGWMTGRRRLFDVAPPYAFHRKVLAVAFNDRCDVIVATVVSGRDVPRGAERAALAFLNSETVLGWAKHELGL